MPEKQAPPLFALEMIGISKRFPGTLAVDCVDFCVRAGEIHALLGENGAGKSTLMKVLAGEFADYEGEVRVYGKPVSLHSPAAAKANGIAMIHQELSLSSLQSVAENLFAGRLPRCSRVFVDRRSMNRQAGELLARVGLHLDPETPVSALSQHECQLVEIAKALGSNPKILVMDEPTSALTHDDVEILLAIMRRLKEQGLAIVFISHHLPEVFQIADRATVLRDGKLAGVREVDWNALHEIVRLVVGRELTQNEATGTRLPGEERLVADSLTRQGFFRDVSFRLRAGEIVGLCGLAGSGRTELARSLCGIDPLHEGILRVEGRRSKGERREASSDSSSPVLYPISPKSWSLRKAIEHGIAYLTEDRKRLGLALRLDVRENALAACLEGAGNGPFLTRQAGTEELEKLIGELQVTPPDPRQTVRNLSGGNQQKVLLAKWLAAKPDVLVLDEPTRGVDLGAKALIHDAIRKLATEGKSVLLISSDLPELCGLADRTLIMRKGRLIGEMPRDKTTEESLLLAINGVMEEVRVNLAPDGPNTPFRT